MRCAGGAARDPVIRLLNEAVSYIRKYEYSVGGFRRGSISFTSAVGGVAEGCRYQSELAIQFADSYFGNSEANF